MIGLAMGTVKVVPYDADWPTLFQAEKEGLLRVLQPLAAPAQIEHVGSTAVRGLPAKPIVDVVIGFRGMGDLRRGLALLAQSGRQYVKGANQPGMLFMAKGEPGQRSFHYHLVLHGTPAWRKLIVFRDYLRRHPGAATEYGELKLRLAERYGESRQDYSTSKKPILRAIMQRGFAEEARRRHAAALHLVLSLDDEPAALQRWWDAGHGRPPWRPAVAMAPAASPAAPADPDEAPGPPDLADFDPGAHA